MKIKLQENLQETKINSIFGEERAQVSFEYLLTSVFAIMLAIGAAMVVDTLRQIAVTSQAQMLSTRAAVLENILQ